MLPSKVQIQQVSHSRSCAGCLETQGQLQAFWSSPLGCRSHIITVLEAGMFREQQHGRNAGHSLYASPRHSPACSSPSWLEYQCSPAKMGTAHRKEGKPQCHKRNKGPDMSCASRAHTGARGQARCGLRSLGSTSAEGSAPQ